MAMANLVAGLSPVRYMNGTPWNGGGNVYVIPSTDTNAYAIGDPVALSGTGDGNGVPAITLASAGTSGIVLGPVVSTGGLVNGGAYVDPAQPNTTIIPATKTKDYYVLVCDDPNVLFRIQDSGDGTAFAATDIGSNANLKSGTNTGYVSGWSLTDTGVGTSASLQVKLMGLDYTVQGNTFGQYAQWLVRINTHQFAAGVAGV